jgi:hypothetical protein
LFVNHTHVSIFYSQAANLPIYLVNAPSPDPKPKLLFHLHTFLVFPAFQFRKHKERSRDFSLLKFTCICQVSTFPNMDTIFHLIYYWFPYLIILYIITMMNAKSFDIILCSNYFCKHRSVIFADPIYIPFVFS